MKKGLFTLLALCAFTAVHATYYLHETFSQTEGALTTTSFSAENLDDWMCGSSWGSPVHPTTIKVVEGNLTYADYATKEVGNRLVLGTTNAARYAFRNFTPSDAPITNGSCFLSAIIRIDSLRTPATGGDNYAERMGGFLFSLGNGTNTTQLCARLFAQTVLTDGVPSGFKLGVAKLNEGMTDVVFGETVYEAGKDYLVVVEYQFVNEKDDDDIVNLYVNPTSTQPDEPTVFTKCEKKTDMENISLLTIVEGSNQQGRVYIDEVKVATDWASLFDEDAEVYKFPKLNIDPFPITFTEGAMKVGETYTTTITITGSNLEAETITLACDREDEVTITPATLTREEIEADEGVKVTLTAAPAKQALGDELLLTLTCGETDKTFIVEWSAYEEMAFETIAEMRDVVDELGSGEGTLALNFTGEALVTYAFFYGRSPMLTEFVVLQDETGAIVLNRTNQFIDYETEEGEDLLAVGNIVTGLELTDAQSSLMANPSAAQADFKVLSKNNEITPLSISAVEMPLHPFEFVTIKEEVTFQPAEGVTIFNPNRNYTSKDSNGWGNAIKVAATITDPVYGDYEFDVTITNATKVVWIDDETSETVYACDLVNTTIPTEAVTLSGIVWNDEELRLRGKQDIKSGATAVENTLTETAAKKEIRDSQLLIRKGDKLYNVLGTQIH